MAENAVATTALLRRKREPRLDRAELVRREMARVYWSTKRGEVTPSNAARFVFILAEIAKLLRDVEIEARLAALERRL